MKIKIWLFVVVFAVTALARGATNDLTGLLQQGLFEEEANRNLDAAISDYQSLATAFDKDRQLAATAIFRLGECYRKLGKTNEAVAQYQRIVKEFGDQPTLVTLSRQNIEGLGHVEPRTIEPQNPPNTEAAKELALVKRLKGMSLDEVRQTAPTVLTDATLISLIYQFNQSELTVTRLLTDHGPEHPEVKNEQAMQAILGKKIIDRLDGLARALTLELEVSGNSSKESANVSNSGMVDDNLRNQYALLKARIGQARTETNNEIVAELFDENKELAEKLRGQISRISSIQSALEKTKTQSPEAFADAQRILKETQASVEAARQQIFDYEELRLSILQSAMKEVSAAGPGQNNSTSQRDTSVTTDEEEKEIRNIQAMIQNSPDLINAPGSDGPPPLVTAAQKGQLVVAKYLLDHGANVNVGGYGKPGPPLYDAAQAGHKAMVELLISRGADVHYSGQILYRTAEKGFNGVAEVLLDNHADPNSAGVGGEHALHLAAAAGNTELIKILLDHGADVNAINDAGDSSLHYAAGDGQIASAKMLLAAKANFELKDKVGNTPLHQAAENGRAEMISFLIEAGAAVDATNNNDATPLLLAAYRGRTEAARILLEHKADPNHSGVPQAGQSERQPPLLAVSRVHNNALLKLLLEAHAEVDPKEPNWNPLLEAASRNNVEAVQLLLQHGANPNRLGNEKTLLTYILLQHWDPRMIPLLLDNGADPNLQAPLSHTSDAEIARELIAHHADVNLRRSDDRTSLMTADNTNYLNVILTSGAKVDLQDTDGNTALHYQVSHWRPDDVALLLEHKANPNIQNNEGMTPLDWGRLAPAMPMGGRTDVRDLSEAQQKITRLLVAAGGLANLPKSDRIAITRAADPKTTILKDAHGLNRVSLLEVVATAYNILMRQPEGGWKTERHQRFYFNSVAFPFPDFKKVTIYRRTKNSAQQTAIKVDVDEILTTGDCSRDVWLEWGDVVEIPEADHPVDQQWEGLSDQNVNALIKCVSRRVTLRIKGENNELQLIPEFAPDTSTRTGPELSGSLRFFNVTAASFMLRSVLDNSKLIRVSSDLSRVKVTRVDAATKKAVEWTFDCTNSKDYDFWVRDGDVIDVPEK